MDVFPEPSMRTWMPAIHAGMTIICIFSFVSKRKIMNRFAVKIRFIFLRG